MRCPNCGNENPPDYLFCDECGARLIGNDVAAMAGAPEAGAVADAGGGGGASNTGGGSMSAAAVQEQPPADVGGAIANYADYGMGANQQMPDVIGQGTDTGMGYVGLNNSDPTAGANDDMGLSAMPVTEDTMGATPDEPVDAAGMPDVIKPLTSTQDNGASSYDAVGDAGNTGMDAGASAYGDAQESISGMPEDARMSIEEGMADMTGISGSAASIGSLPDVGSPDEDEAVAVPSGGMDNSGAVAVAATAGNEWASSALDTLRRAQSALAGGDWGTFGEAMNSLATTLQSAASGSGGSSAAPASLTSPGQNDGMASQDMGSMAGSLDDSMSGSANMTGTDASQYTGSAPAGSVSGEYEAPAATPDSSSMSTAISDPSATSDPGVSSMEPLPIPSTVTPMATAAPVSAPGASGARLILISTGAEMSIPEQEEITVGREDPSSGIFPDIDLTPHGGEDGGVSRRHARMLHIGDDYFVEDLQSTNFTKLDGQRLPAHVRERLEDGARLDFGRVAMIFRRG